MGLRPGRPRYRGARDARHDRPARIGVLLANLGSPAAPTAAAVRPYLRQFLSDPRVIELPRWLWFWILNLVIVPFRSPKSAAAYREVWGEDGSPLLAISRRQREGVAKRLAKLPVEVELGMSYGEPAIADALRRLHARNCSHLLVLPLYPQYAAATVGSVFDGVAAELSRWRRVPQLRFVSGYCAEPGYVATLAAAIAAHRKEHGAPKLTVFSFHGTQLAALEAGDPYHCQCHRTAREAAAELGLGPDEWLVTFQSRFGNDPWLQPYTIEMMARLPAMGITDIQVVCPAFAADCLETLEEISGENQEAFRAAGGERFSYIPALNDSDEHLGFLAELITREIADWCPQVDAFNAGTAKRHERAEATRPLTCGERQWDAGKDGP